MKLSDLAQMLDLSVGTVSMALNDSPMVKKETREKVQKLVKMVNYTPSAIARSLKTKKSKTVGILGMTIFSPYYSQLTQEIQRQLNKRGYLGLVFTSEDADERANAINTFVQHRVDCIMAAYPYGELLTVAKSQKIPVVIFDTASEAAADCVVVDRHKGGYLATEHLIKLGHRKIGFVCAVHETEGRVLGFRAALHDHLIPLPPEWVGQGIGSYHDGYKVMKRLLSLPERPHAVFCLNDVAALGAMRAIGEAGLSVPDDVAVVGFDNIEESGYGYVPLTTVSQPREEIARHAVELFLRRLDNPQEDAHEKITVDVELVIRASCGHDKRSKTPTTAHTPS